MGSATSVKRRPLLDWLYREEFLIGASLARIGFGFILLYMYLIHYAQRYLLWSDAGLIDHATYMASSTKDGAFSLYMLSPSLGYFDLIYHLGIVVAILYLIGWKGRFISILNFIFTISLIDRNVLISDGGDNIMRLILFYLLFANATAYFSADSDKYWQRRPLVEHTVLYKIKSVFHNFAVLFCIVNLCIMYLSSGLYQVMGEVWNNGTAVYYILQVDEYSHPFFQSLLLQNDFAIVLATYASILVKLAFPFLLFNRYTKYAVVCGVIGFHTGIAIVMGLVTFSLIMCMIDFLLITDKEYQRLYTDMSRLARKISLALRTRTRRLGRMQPLRSQRVIVFFDGWCPMCQASVRTLKALDWFGLLRYASFREQSVCEAYGLDPQKAEQRMHSKRIGDTDLHGGIHAFIQISKRIVPMWLISPLLCLANRLGIGQKVYDFIAARRTIMPTGGCDDSCYLPRVQTAKHES
ncbi:DCC1-like thiol-disulfide oxidoreductase family protein [Brevibacillus borstelensis]|uniref:DCC1-like thiol-disulfide oxidoreductase family protein n=1 Tax=Brevibacillus borstelensis TaxID=45462 RepID=UPI0030BF27FF